jgi:2-C-methyl-D-erythritol 4-phosphate cytidylyltransferase
MIFVSALVPAAGSGERLGMGPKAFVKIHGKTLIERTVENLYGVADEIIVAIPASHLEHEVVQRLSARSNPKPRLGNIRFITGGETRQETVSRLLLEANAPLVMIHDAARPFLPPEVARALVKRVVETGAATVALPASDTLVTASSELTWDSLLDRSRVYAIQTPQGFQRDLILDAHARARLEGIVATDDAGLVARLGLPVALVPGDPRLFKVTRPGDYELAEAFAAVWNAGIEAGIGAQHSKDRTHERDAPLQGEA